MCYIYANPVLIDSVIADEPIFMESCTIISYVDGDPCIMDNIIIDMYMKTMLRTRIAINTISARSLLDLLALVEICSDFSTSLPPLSYLKYLSIRR